MDVTYRFSRRLYTKQLTNEKTEAIRTEDKKKYTFSEEVEVVS